MNKSLLAAAVAAGLMVPGLAAADVKIFGVIQAETGDIDINRQGRQDLSSTHMGDGGNNGAIMGGGPNQIGFKGTEKLGNGLKAYFKLNSQFDTFDASSGFTARDSFVGVKGDGWHVQFGRMNTLYKTASHKYDPFVATGAQSRASGGTSSLHNNYMNDLMEVGFKSGAWSGGIQVTWEDSTANANPAQAASDNVDSGSWNGRIKYKANNWEASFSYMDLDYGTASGSADAWKVATKWKGNGFTVAAQYEDIDVSSAATTAGTARRADGGNAFALNAGAGGGTTIPGIGGGSRGYVEDYDSLAVFVTYKLSGSTKLMAFYANADVEAATAGQADLDIDHWAIGVSHSMSKRTSVYGGYVDIDYDFGNGTAVPGGATDTDADAWILGLRHKF